MFRSVRPSQTRRQEEHRPGPWDTRQSCLCQDVTELMEESEAEEFSVGDLNVEM